MKLHHRLTLMVFCTVLGLLLVAGFGLSALRSNMLENKRGEIYTVLNLAAQQVAYYQAQEQRGTLTREAAQAKAIEALSSLRDGKKAYLWARTVDALGLVHPNPEVIGKVDVGVTLPDGRTKWQGYLDGLKNTHFAYFDDLAKYPGAEQPVPKINGITKIDGWNWLVGFGIFVDDIDAAFWRLALAVPWGRAVGGAGHHGAGAEHVPEHLPQPGGRAGLRHRSGPGDCRR